MKTYTEPQKQIPVFGEYDVIVAGGGTAGMVAGVAAARSGAKTLVVERLGCLGGQFTALMNTSWTTNNQINCVVGGIPFEYFKKMEAIGGVENPDYDQDAYILYDSERAKIVMTEMFDEEENLDVLYLTMVTDTIIEGNRIKGIIIENKSGRQAVYAKQFIDCTGDADLLALAGSNCEIMKKEDQHPASLLAKINGVNTKKLVEYYDQHPELQKGERYLGGLKHAGFYGFRLAEELKGITLPDDLEYLRDWFILFYTTPNPDEIILNMTGIIALDGTNAVELSHGEHVSRKRLFQVLPLFKKYIVGFENAYFSSTAPALGVRETRKVIGEVKLTAEMLMGGMRFPDAVCCYQSPLGYHTPDGKNIEFRRMEPGKSYDVPLRCMLPLDIDGVIAAGRNISVDSDAIGSTRSMTNCMSLGQSAGIIAAYAAKSGIEMRKIPNDVLRKELKEKGVYFED